jgi:hypothetical protein
MKELPKNGLGTIAQTELDLERILELIPKEHRGIRFERVMKSFHPQEVTSMLELGFALEWALMNTEFKHQLYLLLAADSDDPRAGAVPKTAREWEVAELVAASVIRWLPTSVGCSFLQEAFRRGGGSMQYELPDPVKGMPPLPKPPQRFEEAANDSPETDEFGGEDDGEDDWPMT